MNQNQTTGPERGSRVGPIVGIIIVVIVLILGALYFWGQKLNTGEISDSLTDTLSEQGISDELDAIESDLGATVIESLDSELQAEVAE